MGTLRTVALVVCVVLSAFSLGCPNREVSRVDPRQVKEQQKRIPIKINRDVDILFVVDSSLSMKQEQVSLGQNFFRFIDVLKRIKGGLPNVHIGVISPDIGIGSHIENCEAPGDDGRLQGDPRLPPPPAIPTCSPPHDPYIIDVEVDEVTPRNKNYSGTLEDTFSCIAQLGINGCGFEAPLEAIRRALDGRHPGNQGFYRPNAYLAIVIISDEDDCSAKNMELFSPNTSSLGPLNSFRCFEYGVKCDPDTPRSPGERRNCEERADSPYMAPVQEYVDFLRDLKKQDNSLIITAGIVGNPEPVAVTSNSMGPILAPSCETTAGKADPAIRLKAFFESFPQRNTITTICDEDLSESLVQIAELLALAIGTPCLEGELPDTDPDTPGIQPECIVSDVVNPGPNQTESLMSRCNNSQNPPASTNLPCWHTVEDLVECQNTPSHLRMVFERGSQNTEVGTYTDARCLAE